MYLIIGFDPDGSVNGKYSDKPVYLPYLLLRWDEHRKNNCIAVKISALSSIEDVTYNVLVIERFEAKDFNPHLYVRCDNKKGKLRLKKTFQSPHLCKMRL